LLRLTEALLGPSVFMGFTGGIGALSNVQDILAWNLTTDSPGVPEPMTAVLPLLGLLGFGTFRKALVVH
jgi:hypothetical protein